MSFEIINPEALGAPRGWNNGMLAPAGGRLLFVAGQVSPTGDTESAPGTRDTRAGEEPATISPGSVAGFVEQFAGALRRVVAIVEQAGGDPSHIGSLTIYVTDMDGYRESLKPLGVAYRDIMGGHYPAMALLGVAGLVDPHAVVEIEAVAVLPA